MPTIQEVRQKYPQYKDMSDQQLADALHSKYYSDLPKNDFYSKIGFSPEEEMGFFNKLPRNIATGVAELGRGLVNAPHNVASLVGLGDRVANLAPPDFDYAQAFGLPKEKTTSDKFIQALAQYAPAFGLPGANIGKAGEAISLIPKVGKFLSEAVSQAIPQAAFGATQNEKPLEGAAAGGVGSVAGSVIGKVLASAINVLKPHNLIKTPLSKKEVVEAYQQAKGTGTDLGNLLQNPKLQRFYENKLPKMSNAAYETMQNTGKQVTQKGNDILTNLLGKNSPENVPQKLSEILTNEYKKHQTFKNDIYNSVDKLAKEHGLKISASNFADKAKQYMGAIEDTTILKHEPEIKSIFNKLANYASPVETSVKTGLIQNKMGEPILKEVTHKTPSLKEANILKGKLSQYASTYGQSPNPADRNMANIFGTLSKALKEDIKSSIESTGNNTLIEGYKTAESNFAKNYSPFLDKDVYKFVSGKADPETIISSFLKTSSTSDLSGKLSKLAERLGKTGTKEHQSNRNLLAYGYLSRALDNDGNLNPSKMATLVNKLGKNQAKTLFPDKALRKQLSNFKSLTQKNKKSLYTMFNPETGQKLGDLAPNVLSQLAGGIGGFITGGGAPGAVLGALAAPVAKGVAAKQFTKLLTDEGARRKIVKSIIAGKNTNLNQLTNALSKLGAVDSEQ